jgi:hypothetical protein
MCKKVIRAHIKDLGGFEKNVKYAAITGNKINPIEHPFLFSDNLTSWAYPSAAFLNLIKVKFQAPV